MFFNNSIYDRYSQSCSTNLFSGKKKSKYLVQDGFLDPWAIIRKLNFDVSLSSEMEISMVISAFIVFSPNVSKCASKIR